MANCNCNDFPISCAPHAPGGDCCHPHGCPPHPHPCPPPPFKGGTSMYIGARYVPIFADPVEWDDEREYEPLTIVTHNGDCYTSKCYVPKGAQLPPYPEGQTKYWVKTSDYNGQFADLKKTVLDLSRLVEQFQKDNKDFTDLINGWNEKVQQWETEMTAWGERLDAVESHITDLTASLNAEIDRAKAAEQANAAAIAQETTDRKQAISELDAAYKAADAAEAQAREAGDAANAAAIAQETTDRKQAISELDAAYKAADTALSDRITANKTDIDALKAEQAIQNTNISKNAKNIADNSAEIAKHAARLTDLESNASDWDDAFPDTTIAQEVQKEELERANADTALNGRCDTLAADVEEVRDLANHKVDTTTYTEGQAAQDTRIKALEGDNTANKTDIDALKAEQAIQNTNISKNAKNIADNSAEIAKHAARLTDLESNASDWDDAFPDTTIAQEVQKEELERANADTALNGRCDTLAADVEEVRDLANHKVDTTTYTEGQAAQDTRIKALEGDNTTNKTDIENIKAKDTAQDAAIQQNKDAIANVTGSLSGYVKTETYTAGQAAQDTKINAAQNAANKANTNIGDWETEHPGQTISQCATSLENELAATDAKADANAANIGDWNTEHPGKTISQAVSDNAAAVAAEQSAREAADTALGERIDAIEGGARHYPTLALLLKKENPLFVPVAGIAICTYDTMTKKTTISYKNVEGRYFLPPNVTCDESQAVLTGILTAYGSAYYLPTSEKSQDENTVVNKVITSDSTPTDFDISGDSTKILRVRFDSDIVSNTFDSKYERFVVSNFSVAIKP